MCWLKNKKLPSLSFLLLLITLVLPLFHGLVAKYNILLPQEIFGTIFYLFVPGYFLTLVLFRNKNLRPVELISLAIGFSLTLPPLALLFVYKVILPGFVLNFTNIYLVYFSFILACRALQYVLKYFFDGTAGAAIEDDRNDRKIALIVFIFFVILILSNYIFSSRQPNIISADASYFYRISKTAVETQSYSAWQPNIFPPSAEFYQPLFQFGIIAWQILSSVDLFFLFRFGFVFSVSLLVFPLFLLIQKAIKENRISIISLALLLCLPALIADINIARPQTLFFYLTPLFLYSLSRWSDDTKISYPWLATSTLISIAAWFIHFISVIYFFLLFAGLTVYFWPAIFSNKKKAAFFAVVILVAAYPYLNNLGILKQIAYLFYVLKTNYIGFNPLRNSFGVTTYLANYAFLVVPLALGSLYLLLKRRAAINKDTVAILLYSGIYFFILEILPRLGFNFLPDRAFSHLALGMVPLAAISLDWILKKRDLYVNVILFILFLASVSATVYVNRLPTYHVINQKEIEAVNFINSQGSKSLVATQIANFPSVLQYGKFDIIEIDEKSLGKIFMDPDSKGAYDQLSYYRSYKESLEKMEAGYNNDICRLAGKDLSQSEIRDKKKLINNNLIKIGYINSQIQSIDQAGYDNNKTDIYVLYSRVKGRSFYSRYDWWKKGNFMEADLKKFDDKRYFEKVFDNGDSVIWKVKNN